MTTYLDFNVENLSSGFHDNHLFVHKNQSKFVQYFCSCVMKNKPRLIQHKRYKVMLFIGRQVKTIQWLLLSRQTSILIFHFLCKNEIVE